jgi:hypothetical protein
MATYYVDSSATGANNGSSKTDAYTVIKAGTYTDGDILLISHTHVDNDKTEVPNGTNDDPVKFISIDFSDDSYTFGARIEQPKGGGYSMYGMHIGKQGTSLEDVQLDINSFEEGSYSFYDCLFETGTSSNDRVHVGARFANMSFKECRFKFNNKDSYIQVGGRTTASQTFKLYFEGCSLASDSAAVNTFFVPNEDNSKVFINGLDVSNANTTSFELISEPLANTVAMQFHGHGIKLPTNGSIGNFKSTQNLGKAEILFTAIDDHVNGLFYQNYTGNITDDLTVYRKALSGTTNYSLKYVTNTEALPGSIFEDGSLSFFVSNFYSTANPTITVHAFGDHATVLTDQEFFIEVEYPLSTGLKGFSSTVHSDFIAGPGSNVTTTGTGWTGASGSNQRFYNPSITISGGSAGMHRVRVYLARASETLYVDPRVDIT